MNRMLWSALRQVIRLRRGRIPPARLPDPIWYFAYGSNMNERLFRSRRHMTPLETRVGRLPGWRLAFTVSSGQGSPSAFCSRQRNVSSSSSFWASSSSSGTSPGLSAVS